MGTRFNITKPKNESKLEYLPGSPERETLKKKLKELKNKRLDIPLIIGNEEIRTEDTEICVIPHNHQHILADYHKAGKEEVIKAVNAALNARKIWSETPWYDRVAVFLKAADLISGPYRSTINAAAMLGSGKTVYQAEIDSVELIDFLRFNAFYMKKIYDHQPNNGPNEWNRMDYRPLEGFVFAVTPFNFLSIMGNLPTAPAIMGNVIIWKPASSAVYPSYHVMRILLEAGLPPGIINFVPGRGSKVGDPILRHPELAGLHFTGSTNTFRTLWKTIGENLQNYKNFPRIVGETGGKDFIFVHESAEIDSLITAIVRGAFQYSGQKCSAASRGYIPKSLWPEIRDKLLNKVSEIKMGDVKDFRTMLGAVIDKSAYEKIVKYIEEIKNAPETEILAGGSYDDSKGYFIEPTIVQTFDPKCFSMVEEIFGPVFTLYVYPNDKYKETLRLCDETSPYGLTGSIFAQERKAIIMATEILRDSAGNFYINNKPTAAVVGRQPFGGARASGTNDKAGSMWNLIRWVSPRAIKENLLPPKKLEYPHMSEP
jgi:1-pyrroline-5-carboxylate dehydrogenase